MEQDFDGYLWTDSMSEQINNFSIPSSPELESDRISEFLYGDQEDSMTDNSDHRSTIVMPRIINPEELAEEFNRNVRVTTSFYENMQQTDHFTIAYFDLLEATTPPLVKGRKVPRVVPDVKMDDDAGSSESSVYMSDEEDNFIGTTKRLLDLKNNSRQSTLEEDEKDEKDENDDEHDEHEKEDEEDEEEDEGDDEMDSQSPAVTAPSSPILSVATSHASTSSTMALPSLDLTITKKKATTIQPMASAVGTISSNLSNVSLNYQPANNPPLPATLALRPVLPFSTQKQYGSTGDKTTVFSGPHHLPEKYSIQPCVDYRKRHLIPDEIYYQHIKPSRYFVSQVNPFFEAAMGDASQFTSYNHYNPSDPVNFRHAYPLNKEKLASPTKLDSMYSQQHQNAFGQSSTTARLLSRSAPNRKRFQTTEYIEESDESQMDEDDDESKMKESVPQSIEIDNQDIIEKEMITFESLLQREQVKPVTSYKISRFEYWLNEWKQSDPECCCVCFNKSTTNNNLLVYCDNPFCEVIVHQQCYNIGALPNLEDPWYCDRCSQNTAPNNIITACPFCPSVKGAFCKLENPIFGCDWAHLLCIKYAFEDLYCYSKKSKLYEVLVDKATLETFQSICRLCNVKEYSNFGAKVRCQQCTKRYHVTCAIKEGFCWINDDNRVQCVCSEHNRNNRSKSLAVVSTQWHNWVLEEEEFILKSFGKSIDGFIFEAWKGKNLKNSKTVSDYPNYQKFKLVISSIKIPDNKTDFYRQVNKALDRIRKKYITNLSMRMNKLAKGKESQTKNSSSSSSSSSSDVSKKRLKTFVSKDQRSSEPDSRRRSISATSTSSSTSDNMGTTKLTNKHMMQDLAIGSFTTKDTRSDLQFNDKKRKLATSASSPTSPSPTSPSPSSSSSKSKKTLVTKKPKISHNKNKKLKDNNTATTITTTTTSSSSSSSTTNDNNATASTPKSTKAPPVEIKPTECSICHQLELPDEVRIRLKLPENYQENLEKTKHKRRPGCTGVNDYWDPRVLIKCRDCNKLIHCGCPDIPITRYDPKKRGEVYICVQCDNPKEYDILKYYNQPRTIKRINYKV